MSNALRIADLFCGAGGTSTGARRALESRGLAFSLVACNHWETAIATHTRNHPDAEHHCADLYRLDPRVAVPGGCLDLLMASPTCTYFSRARGGKPISRDQRFGRMTPTQVVRWCQVLDVRCLLVENVEEFQFWGPVDAATGRPNKAKAGVHFRAWVRKLKRLGFAVEWRILNAADYGDATTRRRFFLLGRRDGKPIRWPAPSHAREPGQDLFGQRARWRPAREIIDWSIPGKSIFRRKKPLSKKTLARILAGIERFGWPEPFLVVLRRHMDGQSIDEPLPTICAGGTHIGQPFVFGNRSHNVPKGTETEPLPGITTTTGGGVVLVEPAGRPFLLPQRSDAPARSADRPLPTATTVARIGMVQPFVLAQQSGGAPRNTGAPLPTITADGAQALITPYYGQTGARTTSQPLPTITTKDRFGLVVPVTHAGPGRVRSVEDPLPTVTAAPRGELAFITAAFGERDGQAARVHSVDEPAPTLCARGRIPLVQGAEGEVYGVDILFRMLQPDELAAAMGFSDALRRYKFAGTKTDITRQIGNAVSVRTAEALVGALMEVGDA